jgi:arabinofuranosyltransferase
VFAFALVMLAWLFWHNIMLASREIDGVRYFVLDDDMMISMRYGRNLAEGHGLVWNPGERVEGYTNFLWTVVMAGVHFIPISESKISLILKGLNFVLLGTSLHLGMRLVRLFAPRSYLATPVLLVCVITCVDVLHWSVWGFETTLLTFLNLLFLVCLFEERWTALGYIALALIPITRSDALYIFAANAFIAFVLSRKPTTTLIWIAAAAVPLALHIAFRRWYYGEWLPNTYYLKVYKLDHLQARGIAYSRSFLLRYAVPILLAAGSALSIARSDRRGVALYVTVLATLGYVVTTGGDMFGNFRFFAHVMPVIFVFAAAGTATIARGKLAALVWGGVLFVVCFPLWRPMNTLVALDTNGDPYEQLQTAMLVRKNARPDSKVAVIPAGILPYFTRLTSIDILGKTDKHIARLTPHPGSMVGHGKLDPAHSLSGKPDLVVSCRSHSIVQSLVTDSRTTDVVLSFLAASAFQQTYRAYPIREEFLLGRTSIYTHPGSPEYATRDWKSVVVRP